MSEEDNPCPDCAMRIAIRLKQKYNIDSDEAYRRANDGLRRREVRLKSER